MSWIKVVTVALPIVAQLMEAIGQRRASFRQSTTDHGTNERPAKEEILQLLRDLQQESLKVESLAQHVLSLQRTVRWMALLSIVSFLMAVTAILWGF